MDLWQDTWNKLNDKLAHQCAEDLITEEEMESILDKCQLMTVSELHDYYEKNYSFPDYHPHSWDLEQE